MVSKCICIYNYNSLFDLTSDDYQTICKSGIIYNYKIINNAYKLFMLNNETSVIISLLEFNKHFIDIKEHRNSQISKIL